MKISRYIEKVDIDIDTIYRYRKRYIDVSIYRVITTINLENMTNRNGKYIPLYVGEPLRLELTNGGVLMRLLRHTEIGFPCHAITGDD